MYSGDSMIGLLAILLQYNSISSIISIISIVSAFICVGGFILEISNHIREEVKVRCKTGLLLIKFKIRKFPEKHVYIYTDCDNNYNVTKDIVKELQKYSQYHIESVDNAEDLQWVPRHQCITQAIIVIITDVSQLSSTEKTRDKIQNDLLEFARNGGILIFGHDVLYRRTKNKILTNAIKCKLTIFERRDKNICPSDRETIDNSDGWVYYKKNPNINNSDLPETFRLRDNEVITSDDWAKQINNGSIIPIYTEEKTGYVLVAKKIYSDGCIFWINSGDHTDDDPPDSLKIHGEFSIAHLLNYLIDNEDLELNIELS